MIRVHCFGLAFTPKLIPTLFVLISLPILLSLGIWQLHRADYKRRLLAQYRTQPKTPLQLKDIPPQPLANLEYRQIKVTDRYDNAHQILIDNKISHHRVGYEVLTPFIPDHGNRVLVVNRGWIAGTGRPPNDCKSLSKNRCILLSFSYHQNPPAPSGANGIPPF